jgi:PDZ domain-containing secreted protein
MMKEALAKLGYNPKDYDELQEVCEEVTEQKPGVSIKVSYSPDKEGTPRVRVTIQGEQDNDVIQEYKDSVPY